MPTTFDKTTHLPLTAEAFGERLRDRVFILGRLGASGRTDTELLSHTSVAGGVRILTRSRVPVSDLPAWLAPRFTEGGPISERDEDWTFDGGVIATVRLTSPSGGAEFDGTAVVTDSADGCDLRLTGTFSMRTPVIGKKVEVMTRDSFSAVLDAEALYVAGAVQEGVA